MERPEISKHESLLSELITFDDALGWAMVINTKEDLDSRKCSLQLLNDNLRYLSDSTIDVYSKMPLVSGFFEGLKPNYDHEDGIPYSGEFVQFIDLEISSDGEEMTLPDDMEKSGVFLMMSSGTVEHTQSVGKRSAEINYFFPVEGVDKVIAEKHLETLVKHPLIVDPVAVYKNLTGIVANARSKLQGKPLYQPMDAQSVEPWDYNAAEFEYSLQEIRKLIIPIWSSHSYISVGVKEANEPIVLSVKGMSFPGSFSAIVPFNPRHKKNYKPHIAFSAYGLDERLNLELTEDQLPTVYVPLSDHVSLSLNNINV